MEGAWRVLGIRADPPDYHERCGPDEARLLRRLRPQDRVFVGDPAAHEVSSGRVKMTVSVA